jgi:hypothetical protein
MADKSAAELFELRKPTQCALWGNPRLARKLSSFELVEIYYDHPNHRRSLEKCRECGQLYFREWLERTYWEGGNDETYLTLIPVQPEEIAAIKETEWSLLNDYPRMLWDDGKWVGKEPPRFTTRMRVLLLVALLAGLSLFYFYPALRLPW